MSEVSLNSPKKVYEEIEVESSTFLLKQGLLKREIWWSGDRGKGHRNGKVSRNGAVSGMSRFDSLVSQCRTLISVCSVCGNCGGNCCNDWSWNLNLNWNSN